MKRIVVLFIVLLKVGICVGAQNNVPVIAPSNGRALYAPTPEYPYAARAKQLEGVAITSCISAEMARFLGSRSCAVADIRFWTAVSSVPLANGDFVQVASTR